jgi:hypothetical protein
MAYGTMVSVGKEACKDHQGIGLYDFLSEQRSILDKKRGENKINLPDND